MSPEQKMREQLRARLAHPATGPDQVICCGHVMDAHDDDGCTVGWEAAELSATRPDGCPCRVRGWAL